MLHMTRIPNSGIDELDRSSATMAAQGDEIAHAIKIGIRPEALIDSVANFCVFGNEHIQTEQRYARHSCATRLQSRFSYLQAVLSQLRNLVVQHESNVQPISGPSVSDLLDQWFFEHFLNAPYGYAPNGYAGATERHVPPTLGAPARVPSGGRENDPLRRSA